VNKRNLIIQAAVAGLFSAVAVSAYATGTGSANGNTAQIASQAVTTGSLIGTGSIQYNETAGIPAGNYELYVQLGNGAKFAQAAGGTVSSTATGFNLLTDYSGAGAALTGTVSGPAGFFSPANQKGATTTGSVFLSSTPACSSPIASATFSISTDGSTVTFTDSNVPNTGGTAVVFGEIGGLALEYVCVQAAVPNAVTWTPGQSYITATLGASTAETALGVAPVTIAKTALYNLQTNGGNATVRSYIPAANGSGAGVYQSFIRVINTGSVTANISAAIVSDTTGLTGTPGVFAKNLPAGAAVTVPSSTIEAAIVAAGGTAPAAASRPRLYISGPTSITVQSFLEPER